MKKLPLAFGSLLLLCLFPFASVGNAALIISYQGSSITAGGFGFVDVWIDSNAALATPDNLDLFSGHFLIEPIGAATPGGLRFVDPQTDSQLASVDYVLDGDSFGQAGFVPLGTVSTFNNPNDTYIGGDSTLSFLGVDLDASLGSFLLFRLDLDATQAVVGDQYTISLINGPFTDFFDSGFGPVSLDAVSFASHTITAVPEPGSLGILAVSGLAGIWLRSRKQSRRELQRQAAA